MTWPDAQKGARTCILLTQYAIAKGDLSGSAASNPYENETVYLPGGEFPETTQHNWDAIISNPGWIRLNWQNEDDRVGPPPTHTSGLYANPTLATWVGPD